MDPISPSPLPLTGGIRPAQSLQGDLASVLRQGRIVAGEVLELLDGGAIVIGLAGQRVQAESHVQLAPGDRFLARVQLADGQLVLELASGAGTAEDLLLSALRSRAGSELDPRGLFECLCGAGATPADLPEVFDPARGGPALALILRRSGLFQESLLAELSRGDVKPPLGGLALECLARQIVGSLEPGDPGARLGLLAWVRDRLATSLSELRSSGSSWRAADFASRLRADLVRSLGSPAGNAERALLRAGLVGLDAAAIEHAGWLPWVALMLGDALDFGERSLRRRALVQLLRDDFKVRLLEWLEPREPGAQREAGEHALRALEAEQLRNVARRHLNEPLHIGFLVPDGELPASAHLLVPQRREPRAECPDSDEGERLTLGVEYSRLGAVRAEILLRKDRLHVRLCASNAATAELLRQGLDVLAAELGSGERTVGLAVVLREGEDSELVGKDLAYLREHHLMDLSG